MKELNMVDLRNQWEPLSTPELEVMLQTELDRKPTDDEKVVLLLHILEAREKELPLHLSQKEEEAWQQYRQKVRNRKRKKKLPFRWLPVAASIVLIVAILFSVVPQQAEAESFWEMLQRITNSVLEYFNPRESITDLNYSFSTDNPGLQQVYDAVVELGVTEPVVPMWLPQEYTLKELDTEITPVLKGLCATFSNGNNDVVFKLDVFSGEPAHQYYKDATYHEEYEWNGTTYNITRNNERWFVIWTKENIECILALDCQEDTLRKILRSIYVTEAD